MSEDYGSSSVPEDDALHASSEWDILAKVNLIFWLFNGFSDYVPLYQVDKSTGAAVHELVMLLGPTGDTID